MLIYPVEIDFSVAVSTTLKISRRVRFRVDRGEARAAVRGTVTTLVPLGLFDVTRPMSLCLIEQALKTEELEPAEVVHLLCFHRAHPQVQEAGSSIIALASMQPDDGGGWCAPCIRHDSGYDFDVVPVAGHAEPQLDDYQFIPGQRILVVPRHPERYLQAEAA